MVIFFIIFTKRFGLIGFPVISIVRITKSVVHESMHYELCTSRSIPSELYWGGRDARLWFAHGTKNKRVCLYSLPDKPLSSFQWFWSTLYDLILRLNLSFRHTKLYNVETINEKIEKKGRPKSCDIDKLQHGCLCNLMSGYRILLRCLSSVFITVWSNTTNKWTIKMQVVQGSQ